LFTLSIVLEELNGLGELRRHRKQLTDPNEIHCLCRKLLDDDDLHIAVAAERMLDETEPAAVSEPEPEPPSDEAPFTIPELDRAIGGCIRQNRIRLGLTQQQMAELIGATYEQAHRCERGIDSPPASVVWRVAQALGVPLREFFPSAPRDRAGK
jgi:DNA-binding XRE family transcriptional regulator